MRRDLVAIAWHDAEAASGWEVDDGLPPPVVWSVGWVEHRPTRREKWWTLVGDTGRSDDREGNRRMKIPAGMVVRVVALGWLDGETLWREV